MIISVNASSVDAVKNETTREDGENIIYGLKCIKDQRK